MAAPPARARADYDYLIKLLLIGDSGRSHSIISIVFRSLQYFVLGVLMFFFLGINALIRVFVLKGLFFVRICRWIMVLCGISSLYGILIYDIGHGKCVGK